MNKLPDGWKMLNLGNVGEIKFSNVDKKTHEGQIPVFLCNYMDVYKNEYIYSKMNFMKATASIQEIQSFKLKKHDVLFTKDSETPDDIANSSVVVEELDNVICGYHLAIVRPNDKIAFGPFLSKQIKSDFVRHQFIIDAKGSTRFGLGLNSISKISIPLPPLAEQKKIAEILSSVDRSIEATEKLIAKLADLKKALMQELFTKGIGHTKFKNSPLGKIPEEWEVVSVGELGMIVTGSTPPTADISNYGKEYLFVTPNDMNGQKYVSKTQRMLSSKGFSLCRAIPRDAVMVTCIASLGKLGLAYKECTTNQQINTIICKKCFNSHYVFYWFQNNPQSVQSIAGETAVPIVNKSLFAGIKLQVPPLSEQTKIASILSSVDSKIEKVRGRLKKLQDLKKGLMQDLLTGKVRTLNAGSRSSQL